MPLQTANTAELSLIRQNHANDYLIFYSNVDGDKMWCPDCVRVEEIVKDTFETANAPAGTIVFVGLRHEWKTSDNVFRKEFDVNSVPSILKLENGKETGRLVDDEITKESLQKFVHA